jgi:hypothetical protein
VHFYHILPTDPANTIPLLLLHGWPGSVFEWYKLIPILIADGRFSIVAPSLPGAAARVSATRWFGPVLGSGRAGSRGAGPPRHGRRAGAPGARASAGRGHPRPNGGGPPTAGRAAPGGGPRSCAVRQLAGARSAPGAAAVVDLRPAAPQATASRRLPPGAAAA